MRRSAAPTSFAVKCDWLTVLVSVLSPWGLQVELDSSARCQPAWHPDGGSLLAAPGTEKVGAGLSLLCC